MDIQVNDVSKIYGTGENKVVALCHANMTIHSGDFISIMGPSGSGKSTLLHIISGLDTPTSGKVLYGDTDIHHGSDKELSAFRRQKIGFIFQQFNLFPYMTALENVAMPLVYRGVSAKKRLAASRKMLKELGLEKHMNHRPSQMSGGQQQRVGIARALVSNPEVIFADEPTGNLDSRTSEEILGLIQQMAKRDNHTLVMVTHDPSVAKHADRVVNILDGLVVDIIDQRADHTQTPAATPESVPTPKNTEEESA